MSAPIEIDTPHGPARVHLERATGARGALVLGHGAGGGVEARDLQAARAVALDEGWSVALVEQPYRVAGRRSPAPATQLDTNWRAVLDRLRDEELSGLKLVTGGRSLGARVACRTAADTGAAAVLCLAFPLHPPGKPDQLRVAHLGAIRVPLLVVQGERDPFGGPEEIERQFAAAGAAPEVVAVPHGGHGFEVRLRDATQADVFARVADVVTRWLDTLPAADLG